MTILCWADRIRILNTLDNMNSKKKKGTQAKIHVKDRRLNDLFSSFVNHGWGVIWLTLLRSSMRVGSEFCLSTSELKKMIFLELTTMYSFFQPCRLQQWAVLLLPVLYRRHLVSMHTKKMPLTGLKTMYSCKRLTDPEKKIMDTNPNQFLQLKKYSCSSQTKFWHRQK